ncbi:uncharacterized protein LOC107418605 isoform X2 [Ziziphus jujuba]|uniref:Uncharacterized protein LOC107418605 isoform X2 n=1 Tax=Ziziphus jujuba TaxID=326968 RepID=A0A6P6G625_ZIZJJ|nr:uncharacterized protein LOC107418605 isoform X2 [Ziziphus jujuba]
MGTQQIGLLLIEVSFIYRPSCPLVVMKLGKRGKQLLSLLVQLLMIAVLVYCHIYQSFLSYGVFAVGGFLVSASLLFS